MKTRGIDVSKWQGEINWEAVKRFGIDFAIIKVGGSDAGLYTDPYYEQNYVSAKKAGLGVGAYYFVGPKCLTPEDGAADAHRFYKLLKDRQFDYPVYLDFEAPPAGKRQQCTNAAIEFCKVMEEYGYYVGIYASDISGFKERLDMRRLAPFDIWVASYGSSPSYVKAYRSVYGMWQFSSTGFVDGIRGNVDLDIAYYDFPTIIKSHHLNGY